MLSLYRRHRPDCPHQERTYRRCKCPLWVQGLLGTEVLRQSLKLRNWDQAQELVRDWEVRGTTAPEKKPDDPILVTDAISAFLADANARHLRQSTIKKQRGLLETQLGGFCNRKGFRYLTELDVPTLREFRAEWEDAAISAVKKLERLRSFFRFCQQSGWIVANPVLAIKPPKVTAPPTLPFTQEEMTAILEACDKFADLGRYRALNRTRTKAMVLLLRYSGLRIRDAVTLTRDRITVGKLFLYTAKTGTPVFIPLPPIVTTTLEELQTFPNHFFWNGDGTVESAVGVWERTLKRLFEISKVEGAHAHRFRDTFAVELLLAGVPMDQVAVLLGHSSLKITEKHYSPWVRSRQERLEEFVKQSWGSIPAPIEG